MTSSPSNVAVVVGSQVYLECETKVNCRWNYYAVGSKQLISIYNGYEINMNLSDPKRLSVTSDSKTQLILIINNIQLSDAGTYMVETESDPKEDAQLIVLGM